MTNRFIFADPHACIGCLNCELACAASHMGTDLEEAYRLGLAGITLVPRNQVVKRAGLSAPMQCMQCEDAPCVKACPIDVIRMERGFVKIYETDCIGCRSCAMVCPFGAIVMSEKEEVNEATHSLVAIKCDLCGGEEGRQACVNVCPTDAISLIDYEAYRAMRIEQRAERMAEAYA
ncbi:4Fe-4S dicluster domain-containing protein [Hydrogenimonas sp.]